MSCAVFIDEIKIFIGFPAFGFENITLSSKTQSFVLLLNINFWKTENSHEILDSAMLR